MVGFITAFISRSIVSKISESQRAEIPFRKSHRMPLVSSAFRLPFDQRRLLSFRLSGTHVGIKLTIYPPTSARKLGTTHYQEPLPHKIPQSVQYGADPDRKSVRVFAGVSTLTSRLIKVVSTPRASNLKVEQSGDQKFQRTALDVC